MEDLWERRKRQESRPPIRNNGGLTELQHQGRFERGVCPSPGLLGTVFAAGDAEGEA